MFVSRPVSVLRLALVIAAIALTTADTHAQGVVPTTQHRVGPLDVALRRDVQTLARLSPRSEPGFDFVPSNRLGERQADGYVHIGDLHLRLRSAGGPWQDFASAKARKPVKVLAASGTTLAAADITPTMGTGLPLSIERRWVDEGGTLVLRFVLVNRGQAAVEVGVLGMPMVFDNIITGRSLPQAHTSGSFVDPYIGRDAGYLQVTRLNGRGPALLVLPETGTPLEAYRPILNPGEAPAGDIFTDRSPRGQTFEGFHDWTVASKALVEREWKGAGEAWNEPQSFVLAPGASRTFGVRFVQTPDIRSIESTLAAQGRPVAVGIPGYVVPTDLEATLFLKSPQAVRSIESQPVGALRVTPAAAVDGWARYTVNATGWGRARLTITYADGSAQTVSYYITKPLAQVMADAGRFATTAQWFDDPRDPFKRAPAILTYDNEARRLVTQETRVWIAGMSDEGGAGGWVVAAIKQLDNPEPAEVAKLERLVGETIVGKLQIADGARKGGVKKSLFYYDPRSVPGYYDTSKDWTTWSSWTKAAADDLGRSYNYPHVAIGHWVLYRLARHHVGLVKAHPWRWYLDFAYATAVAMTRDAPQYAQYGQMEGDVFVEILKDLMREGLSDQARELERLMKVRADRWRTLPYPFGSEMAWDSTGQAEVYAWSRYFGYQKEADSTREVILGYDPTLPHWGYNGNARRYWDFKYGGKLQGIERQLHHYGSTLNAVPLFDAFRANPSDMHLLRVAYGGLMGGITNIDAQGFGSAGFHAWPSRLKWDAYSGDYGMGFFGHCYAAATYLVNDATFGWLAFGGNLQTADGTITVTPRDGARARLFVAPAGLWITLDVGKIASARYVVADGTVTLTLDPATASAPTARVLVQSTSRGARAYGSTGARVERGALVVPLASAPTQLVLTPR